MSTSEETCVSRRVTLINDAMFLIILIVKDVMFLMMLTGKNVMFLTIPIMLVVDEDYSPSLVAVTSIFLV